MTKIVLKKLLIQVILVTVFIFLLIYIPNTLLGPNNIKPIKTDLRGEKGIIFMTGNTELPSTLVADNHGNVLLEKSNQIPKILTIGGKSLLLFKGLPLLNTNITEVYSLEEGTNENGRKVSIKEQKGLLKDIFLNIESRNIFETNYSTSPDNKEKIIPICVLKERKPNVLNCFSINTQDYTYRRINTDVINNKMSIYISNRYLLTSETYHQTVVDAFVSFSLRYINDDKNPEGPTEPLFLFNVTNDGITITQDNTQRHTIDESIIQTDESSYDSYTFFNEEYTTQLDSVHINDDYKPFSAFDFTLGDKQFERSIAVNNPIIGEQAVFYKGKKVLNWFSTFNHNYISAGFVEGYVYIKINYDVYLIDIENNNTYKIISDKAYDRTTRIIPIFTF